MVCNVSGLFLWVDFFARRCKFLYRVVLIRRNGEEKKKGEKEIKRERGKGKVDGLRLDRGCLCKIRNFYETMENEKMRKFWSFAYFFFLIFCRYRDLVIDFRLFYFVRISDLYVFSIRVYFIPFRAVLIGFPFI